MARIRTIKPDFFMSEDIICLAPLTRLLYIALWCHVDREGRAKFSRLALSVQCLPGELSEFDKCLSELISKGHVELYEHDGTKYLYLPTFLKHQRPHHTEKPSELPDANGEVSVTEQEGKGKGKGKGTYIRAFDSFWSEYPKKKNKDTALKAWLKLEPDEELQKTIIKAVREQRNTHDWLKQDGQFIPYASTWLNQKRWEDEVPHLQVVDDGYQLIPQVKDSSGEIDW